MPRSDHAVLRKATVQRRSRETACGRPARYRLLPATTRSSRKVVIKSMLISDARNRTTFVVDQEKLLILVQGHECLYNLEHKDYDNHCWKEILHAQGKEEATQYFVHSRKTYCWYAFV